MEHYGRFAHTGPASQYHELAAPPAARKGIEAGQSRRYADTLPGLAGLLPAFQVVEGGPHDIRQWRDVIRTHGPVSYRGYFRRCPIYNTIRIGDSTRCEFVTEKAHTAAYLGISEFPGVFQYVNAGTYCVGQFYQVAGHLPAFQFRTICERVEVYFVATLHHREHRAVYFAVIHIRKG